MNPANDENIICEVMDGPCRVFGGTAENRFNIKSDSQFVLLLASIDGEIRTGKYRVDHKSLRLYFVNENAPPH